VLCCVCCCVVLPSLSCHVLCIVLFCVCFVVALFSLALWWAGGLIGGGLCLFSPLSICVCAYCVYHIRFFLFPLYLSCLFVFTSPPPPPPRSTQRSAGAPIRAGSMFGGERKVHGLRLIWTLVLKKGACAVFSLILSWICL
jgi:hypothetical protein